MPISVDLDKNPLLRSMVEHVRRDCTVDNIGLVLRARFGKPLPSETADRLRDCPQEELDELISRSAVAPTLDEALMVRLDSAGAVTAGGRSSNREED
ncbi:hypothetical protein [Bradyrhizobium sp. F1.13.3]|uniref:hypothetical protein n=1 Tax=Bradyrhizobium sp. F1.13.3 TaxID=3156351 RepID=UPI003390EA1B